MEVIVQENFYKKLKKLPKDVQTRTYDALKLLERFPFIRLDIKKIKGKGRVFRIRLGRYRIIFILIENKIYVSDIGVRSRVKYR
jgi:mRNA-degrading endonuclease RelE of RelBE toxin-antitoxin system